MKYNPDIHHRRSIRLKHYDYSQSGAYFVTICTQNKTCLFGDLIDGQMILNGPGRMLQKEWDTLSERFSEIELDAFVVMPNHIHGIIFIVGAPLVSAHSFDQDRAGTRPAPTNTIGDIVGTFKSIATHQYVIGIRQQQWPSFPGRLWQRNYYERVIRSEPELNIIREYIANNPSNWREDDNFMPAMRRIP
jgi:putative transposase